jgi:hypothetical protein
MLNANTYANCMDCPRHVVIEDPDPTDSFNRDDKAIVCQLTPNPNREEASLHGSSRSAFRPSAVAVRPYNLRKEGESPKWCPLKDGAVELTSEQRDADPWPAVRCQCWGPCGCTLL